MTGFTTTLQAFFTDRLIRQRQVSPNTLAAYREHFTAHAGLRLGAARGRAFRA